ncbi:MAG: HD domain-containing protein [Bacteriovoracaceae bacterium]|nr:HD domain-containing protein [Bacteriovoracaceae bacterium]
MDILLIAPDIEWLKSAKQLFEAKNQFKVSIADNGVQAQKLISKVNFKLIFLNLDVLNHPGIQVLKFIKIKHHNIPLIFQDSEIPVLSKEILQKFKNYSMFVTSGSLADLLKLATTLAMPDVVISANKNKPTSTSEVEGVMELDKNFTKIKIDEFFSGKEVPFDVLIKMSSGRYLKILHAGDSFCGERLNTYKVDKKVEFLYFNIEDRPLYIRYTNTLLKNASSNKKIDATIKVKLAQNVCDKYVEELHLQGFRPYLVEQGKQIAQNVYKMIKKDKAVAKVLMGLQDLRPDVHSHSFLVTLLSCLVARQFQWNSDATIDTIGTACFFHDIGMIKLPKDITAVPTGVMDVTQQKQYKRHVQLSVGMLPTNSMFGGTVDQIISQHHEFFDGTGFPRGVSGKYINVLSSIVSFVEGFVEKMSAEELTPIQTANKLFTKMTFVQKHNPLVMRNFLHTLIDAKDVNSKTQ